MFLSSNPRQLQLPESLRTQMFAFRRRVWAIKLVEAGCGAAFGVLVAYLVLYIIDRVWDTPVGVRTGIFVSALVSCALVPLALHRWIWRQRRLEQLARLLGIRARGRGRRRCGSAFNRPSSGRLQKGTTNLSFRRKSTRSPSTFASAASGSKFAWNQPCGRD